MQEPDSLVLEILKQDKALKMSVFEKKDTVSTLRHYSQSPVSFSEIEKLCLEITSLLNKASQKYPQEPDLVTKLAKSGQLLWENLLSRPVKDRLKSTKIQNLILSIDEELINIPWELIYDGSNFLCLNFSLGRQVLTRAMDTPVRYRDFSSVPKMLVLVNPTDDLKSAYIERLNIKNQFDRKRHNVHIDFKSTYIDRMYVKRNICDYDIVHFAGHCEYMTNNAQESGWVLSDGKFTVNDILTMGQAASLPHLIFSNACHSATDANNSLCADYQERNYSLASAFLFSGVRHYIGAVRRIEDPASLEFSKEFYTQLIYGKSVGESIRLSRLKLMKEHGIASMHWASYLLYGDPNLILFRRKQKIISKKRPSSYKRLIVRLGAASLVICACVFLYMLLPSINPSTYVLFSKSKGLFKKGSNQEVISLSSRIIKKDPLFLAVYPLLADTYQRMGDRESALKYYFDYMRISEKRKDAKNLTAAYVGIGWVYYLQGDSDKAFQFYDRAFNLSRRHNDKLNEADVLGKLALWQMDKNNYDLALEYLTKSSEINRTHQNIWRHKYNLACDYFNLGYLFTQKEDYVTAREFYDKSFRLFSNLKLKYELSDYYFNVGEIYSFQKEYQKALDYYNKGLGIDKSLGHKPNIAGDYNMIGELYADMDDSKQAEEYYDRAIILAKEINYRPEIAAGYYNLGVMYKKLGRKNRARECLRQAQEIYKTINEARYEEIKKELLAMN